MRIVYNAHMVFSSTASHQIHPYKVATEIYEGPLDLLLQLIEKSELDITRLALAQVTDQYLVHLKQIKDLAAEEVSAFLVIAAKLIQIKSEALLPRPPVRAPDEEDPAETLAQQLLLYKRFRQIADILAAREEADMHSYLRVAQTAKIEVPFDFTDLKLGDLVAAAASILNSNQRKSSLNTIVSPPKITIREKIIQISDVLRKLRTATFRILLGNRKSRLDIVVTFLAMLELIKRRLVFAHQDKLFGEISLETSESWDDSTNFETEFGE